VQHDAEVGKTALVRGPWIDDFIEEGCGFRTASTTTRSTP